MKVKFLKSAVGPIGRFAKGDVAEIDDKDAKSLIDHGIAELVAEKRVDVRQKATAKTKEKR